MTDDWNKQQQMRNEGENRDECNNERQDRETRETRKCSISLKTKMWKCEAFFFSSSFNLSAVESLMQTSLVSQQRLMIKGIKARFSALVSHIIWLTDSQSESTLDSEFLNIFFLKRDFLNKLCCRGQNSKLSAINKTLFFFLWPHILKVLTNYEWFALNNKRLIRWSFPIIFDSVYTAVNENNNDLQLKRRRKYKPGCH